MPTRTSLSLLIALLTGFTALSAQALNKEKLERYFAVLDSSERFLGSVALSQHGQLCYTRSVGFAQLEPLQKADESTRYRIGSISKTFTAVLVMKAIEAGKLNLDTPLSTFFPEIKNAANISIRHLLSHRSGIANFTDKPAYLAWHSQNRTRSEMLQHISTLESIFEPGSRSAYSNSNYVLLTLILEELYQQDYRDLLAQHITGPVGLTNTFFDPEASADSLGSRSYLFNTTWEESPTTHLSIPLGAGGIISTPTDLLRFAEALFGGKLVQKESLDAMCALRDQLGLGLFGLPFYDQRGFGHTGGIDGWSSVFGYFPDTKTAFALCANGSRINNNDVSIALLSAANGKPFDLPTFSIYTINEADLDLYPGSYASAQIPLKITIKREGQRLIAQATGQPSFPLEATALHIFKFEQAGIVMEFDPENQRLLLKQAGAEFLFERE